MFQFLEDGKILIVGKLDDAYNTVSEELQPDKVLYLGESWPPGQSFCFTACGDFCLSGFLHTAFCIEITFPRG